jgi:NAD(P)H-dependent FMN reductase
VITISVIVGSTRRGRFSEKPAQWILQHLQKRDGIEARLLDLRDFPMPFFDQAATPAMPAARLTRMKLSNAGPPQ